MALTQIGRTSTADVLFTFPTLSSKSYKCQFNLFSVRAVTPPIVRTTFCNEANPQQDPSDTTYLVTFAGLIKKGLDGSNGQAIMPLLLTNPYNVPGTFQYDTSCSVAATDWAFADVQGTRVAAIDSTFSGSSNTFSPVTIAWVIS